MTSLGLDDRLKKLRDLRLDLSQVLYLLINVVYHLVVYFQVTVRNLLLVQYRQLIQISLLRQRIIKLIRVKVLLEALPDVLVLLELVLDQILADQLNLVLQLVLHEAEVVVDIVKSLVHLLLVLFLLCHHLLPHLLVDESGLEIVGHRVQLRLVDFDVHVVIEGSDAYLHFIHAVVELVYFVAKVFKQRKEMGFDLVNVVDAAECFNSLIEFS